MNKGISIIVCCYNSEARIAQTLIYLAKQNIKGLFVEIILVDNNSKDETVQIAEKKWLELGAPFPLRVLSEPKQGLSNARFSGALASNYEILVFCDDDNWLSENYLQIGDFVMNKDVKIGALGGFGEAEAEIVLPDWFEEYKGGYAIGDSKTPTGKLNENNYLTGAGMILRRSLFLKAFDNLPSLLLDRVGNQLSSGGDTEICLRFKLMGFELFYTKELVFKHFIPSERLSESYRNSLFEGFKQHKEVVEFYHKLYWVKYANLFAKIKTVLIILIKFPFTIFGFVKRWDLKRDLLMLYIITGVKLLKLPNGWTKLKDF